MCRQVFVNQRGDHTMGQDEFGVSPFDIGCSAKSSHIMPRRSSIAPFRQC
jgi:hypothetical protein